MNAEDFYFKSYNLLSAWNDERDEMSKAKVIVNFLRDSENGCYKTVNDFKADLQWFNVAEPLTLASLKGKLVVLDFFTYCCINCMHILPYLEELETENKPTDGVVVVGVHSAKFDNEKDSANILSAIIRYNINHPVVNDSDGVMWSELQVSCWPTLLVLGPDNRPLVAFVGEGHREILLQFVSVAVEFYKKQGMLTNNPIEMDLCRDRLPPSPLLFPGKVNVQLSGEHIAIADTGHHRVVIIDKAGIVQHHIGSGRAGLTDGAFHQCTFRAPQGLCWSEDGHLLYVADTENHAIRQINMEKKEVVTLVGTGKQGQDLEGGKIGREQCISSPWDVVLGKAKGSADQDVLYIAMAGSHQIWALILAKDGATLSGKTYPGGTCVCVAGSGKEENRNNSYPHKAGFAQPSGICAGQIQLTEDRIEEYLYIADSESSSVRSLSITEAHAKAVKAVVGGARDPTDLFAYGDADGESYNVKLQHPLGITTRTINKGQLVLADSYNHKIKLIDVTTKKCVTVYNGADGALNEPGGLCSHPTQDWVYIADTNNHKLKCLELTSNNIRQIPVIENMTDGAMSNAGITQENNNVKSHPRLTNKRAERRRQRVVHVDRETPLSVNISVKLAPGLHFTEGTTSATQILRKNDEDILPYLEKACEPKQSFTDDKHIAIFTLTLDKSCDIGRTLVFEVESIVYYCSDEGVCKMKATVFEIPVEINTHKVITCQGQGQISDTCEGEEQMAELQQTPEKTVKENVSDHRICLVLNIDL